MFFSYPPNENPRSALALIWSLAGRSCRDLCGCCGMSCTGPKLASCLRSMVEKEEVLYAIGFKINNDRLCVISHIAYHYASLGVSGLEFAFTQLPFTLQATVTGIFYFYGNVGGLLGLLLIPLFNTITSGKCINI